MDIKKSITSFKNGLLHEEGEPGVMKIMGTLIRYMLIVIFACACFLVISNELQNYVNSDSIQFKGDKTIVTIENGKEMTLKIMRPSEYENKNMTIIINDPTNKITMVQVKKDYYKIKANKEGNVKAEIHLTGFDYYMPVLIMVERPHNLLPVEESK